MNLLKCISNDVQVKKNKDMNSGQPDQKGKIGSCLLFFNTAVASLLIFSFRFFCSNVF